MKATPPACPFDIQLRQATETQVTCLQILRFLPGKRCVAKGEWQGRKVLVKLFQHPKSARRHWQREKQGIDWLVENEIATPALRFAGELQDQTPVLIFDFLPQTMTALQAWDQCQQDEERRELLQRLMATIATLHQHGLWQQDLHLDNFLLCGTQVYTIDGDGIQQDRAPLSTKRSRANLALFLAQIAPGYDAMFTELIACYCRHRKIDQQHWLSLLQQELPICRKQRRVNYVKKAFRQCSEFIRHRQPGQISLYRKDAPTALINQLLADPDQLIAQGVPLKQGNSATVVRLHTEQGDWVIKRYNIKGLWHALKRCLRPTRAAISWGNAHRLKISGISTPSALAMAEKRFGPLRFTGYYVCDFNSAPDAADYFSSPDGLTEEQLRTAQHFVTLFTLFHRLGICHGDCKATNFLVEANTPWVIDLDAMREVASRKHFLRLYRQDRRRFLQNWPAQSELHRWFDRHLPTAEDN